MDPDIDIVKRQLAEETAEKYYLMKRVKELTEEIEGLEARIRKLADAQIEVLDREKVIRTISGDERTW